MKQLLRSRQFWLDIAVSAVLPWFIYQWLQPIRGEAAALWWSAVPPAILALGELVVLRKVDLITIVSLAGIAISLVIDGLGGDPRMILVRESLFTGAAGLFGLVSMCWRRPVVFYLVRAAARRNGMGATTDVDAAWTQVRFRRAMYWMTGMWSAGLVLEAVVRTWLSWCLPVSRFLVISPFLQYGSMVLLLLWTYWYGRRLRAQAAQMVNVHA